MRRKRNLEKRIEAVKDFLIPTSDEKLSVPELIWLTHPCKSESEFSDKSTFGKEPEKHLIDTDALFGNSRPLRLEIGCGKGQFAAEIAKRNPNVNFIAVEVNQSVIVQACEKAKREGLKNLKFLLLGAEMLPIYIKQNSIEHIYLNFSTPFPKPRHEKHRLTHENYLNVYRHILASGGKITQKTDNMHFFEFSICSLSSNDFSIDTVSLDLHESGIKDNIETEYEKKFSSAGLPIYMLEATVR